MEKMMRDKILKQLAHYHTKNPWRMLFIVIVLTLLFIFFAAQLTVTMRWSDLLPAGDIRTEQFNKIINEFNSSTSIVVVVQGEESRIKEFADELAPQLLTIIDTTKNVSIRCEIKKLQTKIKEKQSNRQDENEIDKLNSQIDSLEKEIDKKLIQRVDYKTEINFLKEHGLMLIKEKDLKNLKEMFYDPNLVGLLYNLNNSMEKEYVGQEESISTREKEDGAVVFLDAIESLISVLN